MKKANRNIFILMTGSGTAQVLNFVIYMVLAKMYGPAHFGAFGLFTALFFVIAELVNVKMDQSIMLPKSESEARSLTRLSMTISFGVVLVVSLLLFILKMTKMTIIQGIGTFDMILLPIGLLFFGIWQSLQVFCNRLEAYQILSLARVIQVVVTGGLGFLFYQTDMQVNGLIVGFVLGWAASIVILLIPSARALFSNRGANDLNNRQLLNQYSAFAKYGSWSALVNTFSRYLPYYFLMPGFGSILTGQYTLAHKILSAPVGIIGGAIGQVFYKEASQQKDDAIFNLAKEIVVRNVSLALVPTLIVLLFGANLFEWIYGQEWEVAGKVAQILALWMFMTFISGPVSTIIDIKQELKWELVYNIFFLIFRILALLIGVYFQQFFLAVTCYVIVGILFNLIFLWKVNGLLKRKV